MIIRKLFKFEAGHIVRNCTSERCKWSLHGHSFKVEVFFRSETLDNGGMVLDFGLTKTWIKDFLDTFDHTYLLWGAEAPCVKDAIKKLSRRWIEFPFSPSAENLALYLHATIQRILNKSVLTNGEGKVSVYKVRVHETDTGYAETEPGEALLTNFIRSPREAIFSNELIMDSHIQDIKNILNDRDNKFYYEPAQIQIQQKNASIHYIPEVNWDEDKQ